MNTTRAIIDLKALRGLNQKQSMIFALFFGQKGRWFTTDKIFEKIGESLLPEDQEDEEKDLRDTRERACNTTEAKKRGDECGDKEKDGPAEHGKLPLSHFNQVTC
jgi:hypothetical protein